MKAQIMPKTEVMPRDFTFNFTFGFSQEPTNFDEKKNILTVLGVDTSMKINLSITSEEKQKIFDKLQEINFTSYPDKYRYHYPDTEETFVGTPCNRFYLTITTNGKTKTVEWNDCIQSKIKDEKHEALMQLRRLIEKIIWSYNPLKDYHPKRMKM
jgi:hypothetical protein